LIVNTGVNRSAESADFLPVVSSNDSLLKYLWQDTAPIRCIAVGDFDVTSDGAEIVCGGESGNVTMLKGRRNTWTATTLLEVSGTIEFLDIGDLDILHEGNEIVVASLDDHLPLAGEGPGGPEYWGIRVLAGSGNNWNSTLVFKTENAFGKIWGLKVGDFNISNPGDEIIACWEFWFDIASVHVYSYDGVMWTDTIVYTGNMVIMDADIGEVNSSHPGTEIILLDEDGEYIQLVQNDTSWEPTCIWAPPEIYAGREVEIGDVDVHHPGDEIVVRTRFVPGIILLTETNTSWTPTWILNGSVLFTDVGIGDIFRNHAGKELIAIQDRNVTLIWNRGQRWYHQVIWRDLAPLSCLSVGDFDSYYPGDELVVAGHSRYVSRILYRLFPSSLDIV